MQKYAAAAIAAAIFGYQSYAPQQSTDELIDVEASPHGQGSQWYLQNDTSSSQATAPATQKATTLKEAAKGTGIYIGTAVNYWALLGDHAYTSMVDKEFTVLTAENGCKMSIMAKSYTEFDFRRCDFINNHAKEHGQAFRFHTLIWAAPQTFHNPAFVREEQSATRLEQFMNDYIEMVMSRQGYDYPFAWDVINEAVTNGPNGIIKPSPWAKIDDFACKAFKKARSMNPKAELFYNDYAHASMIGGYATKSGKVYEFVKDLVDRDCGIDGVGFQMHYDINYGDANFASIRENVQRYAKLGLKVHFTEVDVRCKENGACPFWDWPQSAIDRQGYVYCQLLRICLDEPNCMSFQTWGFTDRQTFVPAPQNTQIMDKDLKKKNAYYCMKWNLQNFDKQGAIAREKIEEGYGQPL